MFRSGLNMSFNNLAKEKEVWNVKQEELVAVYMVAWSHYSPEHYAQ